MSMQRWDAIGGVLKRRGHPSIVPPTAKAAGKLLRAELDAFQGVAGRLLRVEADAVQNQAGQLLRAEMSNPPQANITSVPLSSFSQSGDTFTVALSRLTSPTIVDLEGTTQFGNDFAQGDTSMLYSGNIIGYTNGTIEMTPSSSTHASTVNAQVAANSGTVQETIIRLGRGSSQATTAYMGANIQATTQGHIYNGLKIYYCTDAVVENLSIIGIPGSSGAPPGETFALNNYRSTNTTVRNVIVDGRGVMAAGMGSNYCQTILVQNSTFANSSHGAGITHYLSADPTYENVTLDGNHLYGINCEKVTGTVTVSNCTFKNTGVAHMCVDTDGASAVVNIYDPIFDGPKFTIKRHNNYAYPPVATPPANQQKISDFHIFQNGVEVTSTVLQIVT